jgi:F0F1-type ATP synthase assembly protein I
MSLTKASEKLGLTGKVQAAFALASGIIIGAVVGSAVWGIPASYQEWVLLGLFGLVIGGASIGTYEVVKHAARKAVSDE